MMLIGELAGQTGLTADTIRFYERRGLLGSVSRTRGGFRLFTRTDVETLRLVKEMQTLGFSLREIREMISMREDPEHACEQVRDLLTARLAEVRAKLDDLARLEEELRRALERCRRALKDQSPARHRCPMLEDERPTRSG